ncbi:MAG: hypothetical protein KJO21_12960 [Verrucomicrobiae bacterium]|nr:hypothetical protein [Verrucomicrobiae bacterium]NNJ43618.1 hypothetical protein [Akkermansiaceae bacterium]
MNQGQFETLLSRALDNDLTAEEFATFEQQLASSPEARARYLEAVDLHNLLDLELQAKLPVQLGTSNVVDVQRIIRKQKRKSMRIAALAAAAVLIIGLVSLRLIMVAERAPTLAFTTAPGSEFTLTHDLGDSETEGMIMDKGSRLQLSRGTVELTFASGVRSIIKAPADMTLHEDDTLFLNRGTAWFEVPEKAIGFTVKTKDLIVVDLGTEFGVLSKPNDYDEVHVIKGKVRVNALGIRKESTTLVANEARRNDPIGRLDTIAAKPSVFWKSLSELPPYLHWSFDQNDKFDVKGSHPAIKEMVITPSPSHSPPELVQGKHGSALSLNGKQQGLLTNWTGIYGADRPLSAAVWVRIPKGLDLTGYAAIVGWGIPKDSKAKWKFFVRHDNIADAPTANISMGTYRGRYAGETRLDDNQWHHIAVVHHGIHPDTGAPDIALYIDGQQEVLSHSNSPVNSKNFNEIQAVKESPDAKPMAIGIGPVPQDVTFRGLIDELYIFDGAISYETIKSLANVARNQQKQTTQPTKNDKY